MEEYQYQSKKCSDLLAKLEYSVIKGSVGTEITDIIYDSRKAAPGTLFVCLDGQNADGHRYITDAVKKGSSVIIIEKEVQIDEDVTVIRVSNTRKALALISATFFDDPAGKLTTIGITGTKGKSSVAGMVYEILNYAGIPCGLIGTIGAFIGEEKFSTLNSTPESYEIHKYLYKMNQKGCRYAVMEVSSQGLKQHRTDGIFFDYGVFTNLSADHIGEGEHTDFAEYCMYKSQLFVQCKSAVGNIDDEYFEEIFQNAACGITTFGTKKEADYRIRNIRHIVNGGELSMSFDFIMKNSAAETGSKTKSCDSVILGLPGSFNVMNAACAMILCLQSGIPYDMIKERLNHTKVKGRIEPVHISDEFSVLIDYAHNELSCRSVLTALREYHPKRIISIFGCGGNRSKDRRYTMGKTVGELSDLSVITADNPRKENVLDIIEDIKVGMKQSGGEYVVFSDRQSAVSYAVQNAGKGDMVVLLGKGHEEYQEIDGVKYHYSEREAVENAAEECGLSVKPGK